ncbi:C-type lectin [Elysia marginata]|uniref:C-type lectin n=1 Tax=Elysia marginata TaxID=1093978 RepID=A0AAV4IFP8_9GAST|nr:C-type lectin [Elysia marginata]
MEKTTSLTVYASRLYGEQGEFDPLVAIDLWASAPQVMNDIAPSDLNVFGRIGTGGDTRSQLTFSWKSSRNNQVRRYKCEAIGFDSSRRVVTISVTSEAIAGNSGSNAISKESLGDLTQTILEGVANSTTELSDDVQGVDADVAGLRQKVDTLQEMVTAQNSTINDMQERVSSFTDLYKFTYVMSNFDVSDIFRGRRYYASKAVAPFNIQAADSLCSMLDGYLVEVDDMDEFHFVHSFVRNVAGTDFFFTGANDIDREGVWKFWHSKKPVTFFHWKSRQPDNARNNEDCVELRLSFGAFNDYVCSAKGKFVCEAQN